MLACFALGADAVQVGSRFVTSKESSAHENFKNAIIQANEGDTQLTLKELTPVRLLKNDFYKQLQNAYEQCASKDELEKILGRARAKKGMFEGDMTDGELEIGQVSAYIDEVKGAGDIVKEIWDEFLDVKKSLSLL
jgi:enoyl-[acyl-carrier protein] reductase II